MSARIVVAAAALFGLAIACESSLPPLASAADASRVQSRFAGSSVETLKEGRTLYVARCGNCHSLLDPTSRSADVWAAEVADMKASKGVHLKPDEERKITAYLSAISSR